MKHSLKTNEEKGDAARWLPGILIFVCAVWGISAVIGFVGACAGKLDALSDFGGWFGAISALFSSLALGGAIYAVLLQREDLELNRKEFREATDAHKSNASSQDKIVRIQGLTTLIEVATVKFQIVRGLLDHLQEESLRVESFFTKAYALCGTPKYPVPHPDTETVFQARRDWPEGSELFDAMLRRNGAVFDPKANVKDIKDSYQAELIKQSSALTSELEVARAMMERRTAELEALLAKFNE